MRNRLYPGIVSVKGLLCILLLVVLFSAYFLQDLGSLEEDQQSSSIDGSGSDGWTMIGLGSSLVLVLGMCTALVYELFIADIRAYKHFMDDYSDEDDLDSDN